MTNFNELTERVDNIRKNFAMNIKTIEHNGVIFPEIPEYVTKNNFKLANETIPDLAKEMLFAWSTLKDNYAKDKVYVKNFWSCLKPELTSKQQKLKFPEDFGKVLQNMANIKTQYSEKKKEYNKAHKKEVEKQKADKKEKYGYATINGEKVEIANPLIEGPRIFIGRGDCAYRGSWVYRVEPEDVVLNSTKKISCPVKGHNWGKIVKKNTMGIATYTEWVGVNGLKINKTIWLANTSEGKANNDQHKFEKARLIDKNWKKITHIIKDWCESDDKYDQQVGCCAYLVANFGIRAGNRSGARENGVVGASTLKVGNVILHDNNEVELKFLGKDSMEYNGTRKVDPIVYKILKSLQKGKDKNDKLFSSINSGDVNWLFKNMSIKGLEDLTNKNFRTYYGTSLLAKEIQKRDWSKDMTDKQFKNQYDDCVLEVAKKLNHKKTISKEQLAKLDESSKGKLQKAKERLKSVKEKVENKIYQLEEKKHKLQTKKPKGYTNMIKEITQEEREWKDWLVEETQYFKDIKSELKGKLENKDISLGTSKQNYSNPSIAYSLAKYCDKNPELILSKALVKRFNTWIDIKSLDEKYWEKYPNV